MNHNTDFILGIISGIFIASGSALIILGILSFFVEDIFESNTIEQKAFIILGAFLVLGIGLYLYIDSHKEKKKKDDK